MIMKVKELSVTTFLFKFETKMCEKLPFRLVGRKMLRNYTKSFVCSFVFFQFYFFL